MDNRELEKKIKDSYEGIAPDIMDSVLSDCDTQKGNVIIMQNKKKKRSLVNYIAGLAAALLLVVGGLTGFNMYRTAHTVTSTIMLDVNPSLEILVNKAEKVLEVNPLNDDAKTVVGNMDFSGSKLDVTVNALIGSMLRNGFISDMANSILVTVDSSDPVEGKELQTRLMSEIDSVLSSENVTGAVLGQTVGEDSEIRALADRYGITVGKARLILQITAQNSFYTFENLVPLTINELNLISESGSTKLENVTSIGTASASAYIGEQAAAEAAYSHAGIVAEDVLRQKCDLGWENGLMVYEIDFDTAEFEFEYDINASTGDVVKFEKEVNDEYRRTAPSETGSGSSANTSGTQNIGEAAAKEIALKHAGVLESSVYDYSCKPDHEHGISVYEIEFKAGGYEYDYDINAVTGDVVKYGKEKDDDVKKPKSSPKAKATSAPRSGRDIGKDKAKSIALKKAGVSNYSDYECEKEYKRGKYVYEVSFDAGGYEYEYEIDAATGDILKSKKERD